jgi:hypothetical protein
VSPNSNPFVVSIDSNNTSLFQIAVHSKPSRARSKKLPILVLQFLFPLPLTILRESSEAIFGNHSNFTRSHGTRTKHRRSDRFVFQARMGRYILCRWPAATGTFPLDPRKPRMGRHRSRFLANIITLCRPFRLREIYLRSRTGGKGCIGCGAFKTQGEIQATHNHPVQVSDSTQVKKRWPRTWAHWFVRLRLRQQRLFFRQGLQPPRRDSAANRRNFVLLRP